MTPAEALSATIPMKPLVPRAPGIECRRHQGGVTLRFRWFRPKHYVISLFVVAACASLGSQWANVEGYPTYLVVATLLCACFAYLVMSLFVNETSIFASETRIDVTYGPIPSPFGLRRSVERSQVKRLAVERRGAHWGIVCQLEGGNSMTLVAPLGSSEQATFVESQLKNAWGLAFSAQETRRNEERFEAYRPNFGSACNGESV